MAISITLAGAASAGAAALAADPGARAGAQPGTQDGAQPGTQDGAQTGAQTGAGAGAAEGQPATVFTLPTVEIIGTSPVMGTGIEKDKVPANVQTIGTKQLDRPGAATLADILNSSVGSVSINDTTVNPFQPDVNFRGFTASPLLGVPQGIAIYQNGVRVNEPFGDTVQWDMVPEFAIDSVQVIPGSNPVYGLNALGGAIAMQMKNGFGFQGGSAEAYGGSFGRKQGTMEYGAQAGDWAFYFGGTGFDEDGWRDFSPSTVGQAFSDLRYRGENTEVGLSITYADTNIHGVQPAPVELLAQDRAAAFTGPDFTQNKLFGATLDGNAFLTDTVSVQGNAYLRRLLSHGLNSNQADFADCTGIGGPPGTLCSDAGTVNEAQITDTHGNPIPTSVGGDGVNVTSTTDTLAVGGSLQTTIAEDVLSRKNQLVAGASMDVGRVNFRNEGNIGFLDSSRLVQTSGIYIGGPDFNTLLDTQNTYFGLYASDNFSITDALTLQVSGRYNHARVKLMDRFGTDLDGEHSFNRFNPAMGLTYKITDDVSTYASYSEANRAPTSVELSCADPTKPCRVPNAFLSDPALGQVVSRSVEAGLRGRVTALDGEAPINWSVTGFGTRNFNDIIFVSTGAGTGGGFFQNAGITQRMGVEVGLNGNVGKLGWYVNYSYTRATFESNLTMASPFNPFADANGDIHVQPGNRIPGIPLHTAKIGVNYDVTKDWNVALETIVNSGQFLRGDEANLLDPVSGYAVVNLNSSYRLGDNVEAFVKVNNLLDTNYETFGALGSPGEVLPGFTDPRFLSPGAPIGAWAGLRVKF
ncbi:MAG: TonB-dependent receptor [Alphaproteobacteria bacterium]